MSEYEDGRLPLVPHTQIAEWIGTGWRVWEENPTFTACNKLSRVYRNSKGDEKKTAIWDGWTIAMDDSEHKLEEVIEQ